jgi:RNA polymerase-interacting CarD/CdnL/TRCF family regulator
MAKYEDSWCQEAYDRGFKEGRDFEKDQLTKAKELLKKCVCIINRLTPTTALLDKNERSLLKQAEQFLNSEVEK